ncbi:hypothetical protein ACJX0J_039571, partial [Zea mays]
GVNFSFFALNGYIFHAFGGFIDLRAHAARWMHQRHLVHERKAKEQTQTKRDIHATLYICVATHLIYIYDFYILYIYACIYVDEVQEED